MKKLVTVALILNFATTTECNFWGKISNGWHHFTHDVKKYGDPKTDINDTRAKWNSERHKIQNTISAAENDINRLKAKLEKDFYAEEKKIKNGIKKIKKAIKEVEKLRQLLITTQQQSIDTANTAVNDLNDTLQYRNPQNIAVKLQKAKTAVGGAKGGLEWPEYYNRVLNKSATKQFVKAANSFNGLLD